MTGKRRSTVSVSEVVSKSSETVAKVPKPKKKKRQSSGDNQHSPIRTAPDIQLVSLQKNISPRIQHLPPTHQPNFVATPVRPLISLPRLRYDCINREYSIVVIPPDRSFLFFGWAGITCLGGSIQIDGFEISAGSFETSEKMFHVCSPVESNRPAVVECTTVESLSTKELRLKYRLKEVFAVAIHSKNNPKVSPEFEKIVYEWTNSRAAVLIVHRRTPVVVDLYKQIHEEKLYLNQSHWRPQDIDLLENPGWHLYRRITLNDLNLTLIEVDQKRSEGGKVTLLPAGSKSSGKSTFVRYLCNRLLASDLPLYVLDLDLGQPEFTPAGCMSLWKVTKPLLDTPWCHQKSDFENCYFYGDLSPADDIPKYKNIFTCLLNAYQENSPPGSVLIINPMGWIEGPGLDILQHIVDWAEPDYFFQLTGGQFKQANLNLKETTKPVVVLRDFPLRDKGKEWEKIASKIRPKFLNPAALRDLRIMGYFASMMNKPLMYTLNQAKIIRIGFQKALFAIPEDLSSVSDRFFFGTLNAQVVALCSTTEPLPTRRLLGKQYLPSICTMNQSSPLLHCHGYAIINAVDMVKKQFILITPVSSANLEKVTVIARGNRIVLPSYMTKTANGAPTMYTTGPTDPSQSINADLYGSLRMDRQQNFHREHFPVTQ